VNISPARGEKGSDLKTIKDAKSSKGGKVGVTLGLFVLVLDMVETFCLF
jgi:hypothetical protein